MVCETNIDRDTAKAYESSLTTLKTFFPVTRDSFVREIYSSCAYVHTCESICVHAYVNDAHIILAQI